MRNNDPLIFFIQEEILRINPLGIHFKNEKFRNRISEEISLRDILFIKISEIKTTLT